jgi:hypothetical protein
MKIWMKTKWMTFFMNVGNNKKKLRKIEQVKQGGKKLCWFILNNLTFEMLKSYFKSYFIFFKYEIH